MAGENDDVRTWRRRLPARPLGEVHPRRSPVRWQVPEARGSHRAEVDARMELSEWTGELSILLVGRRQPFWWEMVPVL